MISYVNFWKPRSAIWFRCWGKSSVLSGAGVPSYRKTTCALFAVIVFMSSGCQLHYSLSNATSGCALAAESGSAIALVDYASGGTVSMEDSILNIINDLGVDAYIDKSYLDDYQYSIVYVKSDALFQSEGMLVLVAELLANVGWQRSVYPLLPGMDIDHFIVVREYEYELMAVSLEGRTYSENPWLVLSNSEGDTFAEICLTSLGMTPSGSLVHLL